MVRKISQCLEHIRSVVAIVALVAIKLSCTAISRVIEEEGHTFERKYRPQTKAQISMSSRKRVAGMSGS